MKTIAFVLLFICFAFNYAVSQSIVVSNPYYVSNFNDFDYISDNKSEYIPFKLYSYVSITQGDTIVYFSENGEGNGGNANTPLSPDSLHNQVLISGYIKVLKRGDTFPVLVADSSKVTSYGNGGLPIVETLYWDTASVPAVEITNVLIQDTVYHNPIENANIWYFSATGDDANSGHSISSPKKTLSELNALVDSEEVGMGDTILFNGADTFIGGIEDIPSYTYISSYGSGIPVIKGSITVDEWTLHSDSIYKATVSDMPNQLFVNGSKMPLASNVNIEAAEIYDLTSVSNDSTFVVEDLIGTDFTGALACINTTYFTFETRNISDYDPLTGTFTLDSATTHALNAGSGGDRMFVANSLSLLDEAGEWCFDKSSSTLYFWSPDGGIPENVEVSNVDDGLYISGKSGVTIEDIAFQGFDETGIQLRGNSPDITINNCDFENCYLYAIDGEFKTTTGTIQLNNLIVTNNTIKDCFGSGISYKGEDALVKNNVISNTGLYSQIGTQADDIDLIAIKNVSSHGSVVTENDITNVGYIGISFHGEDQEISKNIVDSAMLTLRDGGGLYMYNAAGTIVTNNIISNIGGGLPTSNMAMGIYLDATSSGVTIENNTVYNCLSTGSYGIELSSTTNTTVKNNLAFNNGVNIYVKESNDLETAYDTIVNNIFYSLDGITAQYSVNDTTIPLLHLDSNMYFSTNSSFPIESGDLYTLNRWQSFTEMESNSSAMDSFLLLYEDVINMDTIIHSTFDNDVDSWLWGEWTSSSPISDGGALLDTFNTLSTYPFSINKGIGYSTDILEVSFDVVATEGETPIVPVISSSSMNYMLADNDVRNYSCAYTIASGMASGIQIYGTGDNESVSLYYDNIVITSINATHISPTEKSKLFVNDTSVPKTYTITDPYVDLDGNPVTSLTLEPFTSEILIKQ